jgi:hypothetical protein
LEYAAAGHVNVKTILALLRGHLKGRLEDVFRVEHSANLRSVPHGTPVQNEEMFRAERFVKMREV